jgi:hypothetical protein
MSLSRLKKVIEPPAKTIQTPIEWSESGNCSLIPGE